MEENIHIINSYRVAQLVHNKYLIELSNGVFVDIHEVVRKNKEAQERIRMALGKIQLLIDMEEKILNEITGFCEECLYHECCPEDECVLFRIEQIITNNEKENISNSKLEDI